MTQKLVSRLCPCGAPATNPKGRPRCGTCRKAKITKLRTCACGTHFKTTNNSTRCGRCSRTRYNSRVDRRCPNCGTAIDYRARNCGQCVNRNGGHLPIGSKHRTQHGYIEIKTEEGWRREHVYVMEQALGRKVRAGETVHHKNGVRDDNRPENLELWASGQPRGARVEDLLEWAREIIRVYG